MGFVVRTDVHDLCIYKYIYLFFDNFVGGQIYTWAKWLDCWAVFCSCFSRNPTGIQFTQTIETSFINQLEKRFRLTLTPWSWKKKLKSQQKKKRVGGWTNPSWCSSQIGSIFPKVRGENSKNVWNHHLDNIYVYITCILLSIIYIYVTLEIFLKGEKPNKKKALLKQMEANRRPLSPPPELFFDFFGWSKDMGENKMRGKGHFPRMLPQNLYFACSNFSRGWEMRQKNGLNWLHSGNLT